MTDLANLVLDRGESWLLVMLAPVLVASLAAIPSTRRALVYLTPWAALPALLAALLATPGKLVDLPWILLGTRLGATDGTNVFLFLTALIWMVAGFYAVGTLARDPKRLRFHVLFLVTMSGSLGVVIAQDMVSFYSAFAIMTFASYGLVIHDGLSQSHRAGRVYVTMAIIGEVLLFSGMAILAQSAKTIYFNEIRFAELSTTSLTAASILAVLGLGVKSGLLGLHMWMPLAYSAAPAPARAVLGGAMINAGLIGWIRLLPLGQVELPVLGMVVAAIGCAGAFVGVVLGIMQKQPKTLLAYSSLSQIGLMTMIIGGGLMSPDVWPLAAAALILYALHHSLAKASLFLVEDVSQRTGHLIVARQVIAAALVLLSLSLAGAPFTSGMLAKVGMKASVLAATGDGAGLLSVLLPLTSLGTALLMFRFSILAWPTAKQAGQGSRGALVAALALVCLSSTAIWFWAAGLVPRFGDQIWTTKAFLSATWPILAGALIGGCAMLIARRGPGKRIPHMPRATCSAG